MYRLPEYFVFQGMFCIGIVSSVWEHLFLYLFDILFPVCCAILRSLNPSTTF